MLRDVGPAHVQSFGQLTGRARLFAQQVHELVACWIRERRKHGGVDGVALSVVVHDSIIAEFRNFATWQSLRQARRSYGRPRSLGKGPLMDLSLIHISEPTRLGMI